MLNKSLKWYTGSFAAAKISIIITVWLINAAKCEKKNINKIINDLAELDVNIKVIPDMYNILTGMVKMTSIFLKIAWI